MNKGYDNNINQQSTIQMFPGQAQEKRAVLIDLDSEVQVIGAVLANNNQYKEVATLSLEHFGENSHQIVWAAITELLMKSKKATPATVAVYLGEQLEEIGGRDFLLGIASYGSAYSSTLPELSDRLKQLAQWRALNQMKEKLSEMIHSQEKKSDEVLSNLIQDAERVLVLGKDSVRSKSEIAQSAINVAMEAKDPVTTGINDIDFLLGGGLIAKRLISIMGKTGLGKTILAGTISENLNYQKEKHLFISLETPPEDIEVRSCARNLQMNAAQLFDSDDELYDRFKYNAEKYVSHIEDNTLYDYCPGATMNDIHRAIIRAKYQHGIKGFILDYWQLIKGKKDYQKETSFYSDIADQLATICRKENLWGLVMAQCDSFGRLISEKGDGLARSASLLIRMQREENGSLVSFSTEKSNYSRYAQTGNSDHGGTIFDMVGPSFRNFEEQDFGVLNSNTDSSDHIDID